MTADEILARFRENHFAVYRFVEQCPDDRWTHTLPDGERTVAAVAMHIARSYDLQRDAIEALAAGRPPPESLDRLDETNAANARRDAGASKSQVIALLNAAAFRLEFALGRLSSEQLATPITTTEGPGPPLAAIIERAVLEHPLEHLEELRAATSDSGRGPERGS